MKDHLDHARSDTADALTAWKAAARRLRTTAGIGADLDQLAQDQFRETIVRAYWKPVFQDALGKCDWSQSKLSARLGTSRATINRWDGHLVGRDNKQSIEPSLSSFLQALCAFQVDHESLPDGLSVTLEAYRQAHAEVARVLDGARPDPLILDAEILCLHYLCRSKPWREARLADDATSLTLAGEAICQQIARLIPNSGPLDVNEVRAVADQHLEAWSILETVILHEWF